MSESERSEAFGTSMSSEDAAELEELRREAAILREQLENAVGPQSGLRSARDVHQLEATDRLAGGPEFQADGNPQGGPSAVAGAARGG